MNRYKALLLRPLSLLLSAALFAAVLSACGDGGLLLFYEEGADNSQAKEYAELNEEKKTGYIEALIEEALLSGKATVEFGFDPTDRLKEAYNRVILAHPELFWLSGSYSYKKQENADGSVKVIFTPEAYLTNSERQQRQLELNTVCDTLLEEINLLKSDYAKAAFIHDYLIDSTAYDRESADAVINADKGEIPDENLLVSASLYGCLVNKKAICTGYAAAFMYLAEKSGLEAERINGKAADSGVGHQWNCVKIEDEWYYADVTWDDSDSSNGGARLGKYEFFLITSEELLLTHIIDEDMNPPECNATEFNYYVKNGLFLEKYTQEAISEIFNSKLEGDALSIKFASKEECDKAFSDLFEEKKLIWQISAVKAKRPDKIDTYISSSGTIISFKICKGK